MDGQGRRGRSRPAWLRGEDALWRATTRANAYHECYSAGARVLDPVWVESERRRAEREAAASGRDARADGAADVSGRRDTE